MALGLVGKLPPLCLRRRRRRRGNRCRIKGATTRLLLIRFIEMGGAPKRSIPALSRSRQATFRSAILVCSAIIEARSARSHSLRKPAASFQLSRTNRPSGGKSSPSRAPCRLANLSSHFRRCNLGNNTSILRESFAIPKQAQHFGRARAKIGEIRLCCDAIVLRGA